MPDPEVLTPPVVETPSVTSSWRDTLPDDLKADKSLESFKDVTGLAKSYVETKKMVGAKAAIPGEGATPEERKAFHKALGVPDTPADYKVKAHEMMAHPEWNRAAQDDFVKLAHAQGFTPAQVDTAIQFYANFIGTQVKDNARMETEAKVELRNTWGVNYEPMMGAANRGISRVEQALKLEQGTLVEATKGTNPAAVAQAFAWVEQQFLEHGFVQGEQITGLSREDATAKLATIDMELAKLQPGTDAYMDLIDRKFQYLAAAQRAA